MTDVIAALDDELISFYVFFLTGSSATSGGSAEAMQS
jgi:hypothetical protein